MKYLLPCVLCACMLHTVHAENAFADKEPATELSQEEIDKYIGRYGEVEEIPEGFQFSDAENKIWRDEHLDNIDKPISLYYEFVKDGSLEDGFSDSVHFRVLEINADGTKNTRLDFFTAERKQFANADNVLDIRSNPVIGLYMQGDVYEMDRLTEGSWRHFQKQIKIAFRNDAKIESFAFEFDGEEYNGHKIHVAPYLNDPHRKRFLRFADKYYEFVFSEDLPGKLYQIKTVIPDQENPQSQPLIIETLTLAGIQNDV